VANIAVKEILLDSGSPALSRRPTTAIRPVLARLDAIGLDELEDLIVEAWRCFCPTG